MLSNTCTHDSLSLEISLNIYKKLHHYFLFGLFNFLTKVPNKQYKGLYFLTEFPDSALLHNLTGNEGMSKNDAFLCPTVYVYLYILYILHMYTIYKKMCNE